MAYFKAIITLAILLRLANLCSSSSQTKPSYIRDACSVTRYQNLCIHSLSSFSNTAKRNPTIWARAGVSVTIREAKGAYQQLMKLKQRNLIKGGRNRVALSDCIECFQDSIDNLHRSLGVLRKLNGRTFATQMGDATTWLSAALTDDDTCLDGFGGRKGEQVRLLVKRVRNVGYITSNALALVNKLATTGPGELIS